MPRNIEIKARLAAIGVVEPAVAALASHGPRTLVQDDRFFHCRQGRLKLRVFGDGQAELIAYERPDATGPRTSLYVRTPVADPASMHEALAASCGLAGQVRKHRTVYWIGRTRVHLDRVEGLGDFLELEVVLADGEQAAQGVAEARALMAQLGVAPDALLPGAYLDLQPAPATGPATGPSPAG